MIILEQLWAIADTVGSSNVNKNEAPKHTLEASTALETPSARVSTHATTTTTHVAHATSSSIAKASLEVNKGFLGKNKVIKIAMISNTMRGEGG